MWIQYTPTYEWKDSNNIMLIISTLLTLWSLFARFQWYVIAIKNLSLGQYSFLIAAVLFFLWIVYDIVEKQAKKKNEPIFNNMKKSEKTILLKDKEFTFPFINNWKLYSITIPYTSVDSLWSKESEEDGNSQIIHIQDKYFKENKEILANYSRFEWNIENFWSESEYKKFEQHLNTYCTSITNR